MRINLTFLYTLILINSGVVAAAQSSPTSGSPYSSLVVLIALIALVIYVFRKIKTNKNKDVDSNKKGKLTTVLLWILFVFMLIFSFSTFAIESYGRGMIFGGIAVGLFVILRRSRRRDKEAQEKRARQDIITKEQVNKVHDGELPTANPRKAILRNDEIAYFAEFAKLRENKTVGYSSGGSSVRVRVAKGVSIGSGGGRSRAMKEDIITSEGELVITNRRVIFAGNNKSFETPLTKLTNYESYLDGIKFHMDSKSYLLLMDESNAALADAILDNIT
ncbi:MULTISPECIES: hypothetical protein [Yersinia pseudotuberculosis complex]|uniref:Uncharacterized protein n=2 Tax=Yersinia pseudotuberculosis complex TaxID=1649845 RepID=A0ABM5Q3R5_9GAMM|nr:MULTISPECIES: hypothetical protein [Yersinia pseudotuberculosis complex]ABS49433.1 hypothetical protein YpsIP31758_2932 [Yersinia pseudotuberculosis IP 31758]AHK21998.1 hypothetical protein BF17_16780 [Yersinia similis]AJK16444.1 hypothetical protein BZ19_892 [Yersinia pseudotuberculosis str. PA3606]MCE4111715.1 hypothetical protein [Yersinia pseudotuberculosis]MCF1163871.1 hypothetical protein [Yersinia pseudotuberculosis]